MFEDSLCRNQIGRCETFSKSTVNRPHQISGAPEFAAVNPGSASLSLANPFTIAFGEHRRHGERGVDFHLMP
jgi:hypothetical protein